MNKSINAWSVPGDVTFEQMFADIAAAGFDAIELNVDAEGASAHSLSLASGEDTFARIRELSARHSLPVTSISTSLYGGKLCSPCEKTREEGKDLLRCQLRCARALGAGAILVVPGGIDHDLSILAAWQNAQTALRELIPEIVKAGIAVGLENVWNNFFPSAQDMARFIDELGCPHIGAYFDVGNVAVNSYPQHWIDILGKRIQRIHVKDFRRMGAYHGAFVNLLEGDVRWDLVMPALRRAGYDGPLTAELDAMPRTPHYLYDITARALDIILAC